MGKEKIDIMVEGGKAVVNPAVAQKLGPLKINISDVMSRVNDKTKDFKGMQVPVKLLVDTSTKQVDIEIGTPPTTELIKKELNLEKGSGEPNKKLIGNISIEQIIKISKMKQESFFTKNLKSIVKSIIGSASSLGVLTEGKTAAELIPKINGGKFKEEIEKGITIMPSEKKAILEQQLKQKQIKLEKELAKLEAMEEKVAVPKVAEEKAPEAKAEGEAPKEGEMPKEGAAKPAEIKGKPVAPAKVEEKKK